MMAIRGRISQNFPVPQTENWKIWENQLVNMWFLRFFKKTKIGKQTKDGKIKNLRNFLVFCFKDIKLNFWAAKGLANIRYHGDGVLEFIEHLGYNLKSLTFRRWPIGMTKGSIFHRFFFVNTFPHLWPDPPFSPLGRISEWHVD